MWMGLGVVSRRLGLVSRRTWCERGLGVVSRRTWYSVHLRSVQEGLASVHLAYYNTPANYNTPVYYNTPAYYNTPDAIRSNERSTMNTVGWC